MSIAERLPRAVVVIVAALFDDLALACGVTKHASTFEREEGPGIAERLPDGGNLTSIGDITDSFTERRRSLATSLTRTARRPPPTVTACIDSLQFTTSPARR